MSYPRARDGAAGGCDSSELPRQRGARIELLQGALIYRDQRLAGFDAAAVVEVIEHLDPPRLRAFERVVFEFARPGRSCHDAERASTTCASRASPPASFRHRDHRFEWTRAEFAGLGGGRRRRVTATPCASCRSGRRTPTLGRADADGGVRSR